jgi:hypothetical protein
VLEGEESATGGAVDGRRDRRWRGQFCERRTEAGSTGVARAGGGSRRAPCLCSAARSSHVPLLPFHITLFMRFPLARKIGVDIAPRLARPPQETRAPEPDAPKVTRAKKTTPARFVAAPTFSPPPRGRAARRLDVPRGEFDPRAFARTRPNACVGGVCRPPSAPDDSADAPPVRAERQRKKPARAPRCVERNEGSANRRRERERVNVLPVKKKSVTRRAR